MLKEVMNDLWLANVKDKKIHEARAFNFAYRYIDDVLSINNSRFAEFLPLIYPPELNYEFGLSLCKIVRSSVILLLPLYEYKSEWARVEAQFVPIGMPTTC
jgi:hypothetical protein